MGIGVVLRRCCGENMNVKFAHVGKGFEGSEEVVSKVDCGHVGRPWERSSYLMPLFLT